MSRSGRRSALRLAARAAVFALIGAAATVLVAWTLKIIAAKSPGGGWNVQSFVDGELRPWPVPVPPPWTVGRPDVVSRRLGVDYQEWAAIEYQGPSLWVEVLRVGLPLKAISSHHTTAAYRDGRFQHRHSGVLGRPDERGIGSLTSLWRGLPCNPLWPGFLVDTAFWGGAAFLVWSLPGFVRRRSRRGRGWCATCGYDLSGAGGAGAAGGGVCPECGGGGA